MTAPPVLPRCILIDHVLHMGCKKLTGPKRSEKSERKHAAKWMLKGSEVATIGYRSLLFSSNLRAYWWGLATWPPPGSLRWCPSHLQWCRSTWVLIPNGYSYKHHQWRALPSKWCFAWYPIQQCYVCIYIYRYIVYCNVYIWIYIYTFYTYYIRIYNNNNYAYKYDCIFASMNINMSEYVHL